MQPGTDDFEDPPRRPASDDDFVLRLEAYEGPIDVLLDQARQQRVDLTQISILALADQYLAFIERVRRLRLELAADYLVMAAWLAYLKSRLLLPERPGAEEPSGEELAAALSLQLRRLDAMRNAGRQLMALPQLGQALFARGAPEPLSPLRRPKFETSILEVLRAFAGIHQRKRMADARLDVEPSKLYSTERALQRLRSMLGDTADWRALPEFLPDGLEEPIVARSALAATFSAALELTRDGAASLRQEMPFAPLYLRARAAAGEGGRE